MWKKIDKILEKTEKKGFEMANKAHIYTINAMLCFLAYNTYTLFRDYNSFFLNARVLILNKSRKKMSFKKFKMIKNLKLKIEFLNIVNK